MGIVAMVPSRGENNGPVRTTQPTISSKYTTGAVANPRDTHQRACLAIVAARTPGVARPK
jgi:hypothetical protein